MPYSRNSELPVSVRDALPDHAQSIFRNVVNSALAGDASEESAFKQAWAAVKRSYVQEDGEWVAKARIVEIDTRELKFVKFDAEQRMVYGWASVISENGTPFVDSQGDIIEPDELLKATTEFMQDARLAKAMHDGSQIGEVVHSFPLVVDIAKTFGITCDREGWIVGVKVKSDAVWNQVKDGTFRAFSIGAHAERVEA